MKKYSSTKISKKIRACLAFPVTHQNFTIWIWKRKFPAKWLTLVTLVLKLVLVEVSCTKTNDSVYYAVLCANFKIVTFQKIQCSNFQMIEVKRGHMVKKGEFGQTKKPLYINFSKLVYVVLWSLVNFCIKQLKFETSCPRCKGLRLQHSDLEPLNLKPQISNLSNF